jgi:hypothetical protein
MSALQAQARLAQETATEMLQKHVSLNVMREGNIRKSIINDNDSVLNTVLNTDTIRLVRSFSIPPEKVAIYKKFCEIARCEAGARGFSEVVLKAMEEYNRKHEAGNPQLKLTPYIDNQAPSPMRVLCLDLDGALSDGTIHCNRAGMWIKGICCYSCQNNRLRKAK